MDFEQELEQLWDAILSRNEEKIKTAYCDLEQAEKASLLAHLRIMAHEEGWHPEQKKSAQIALKHLETPTNDLSKNEVK